MTIESSMHVLYEQCIFGFLPVVSMDRPLLGYGFRSRTAVLYESYKYRLPKRRRYHPIPGLEWGTRVPNLTPLGCCIPSPISPLSRFCAWGSVVG